MPRNFFLTHEALSLCPVVTSLAGYTIAVQLRVLVLLLLTSSAFAQWIPQVSNTTASLRGLSVVDSETAWASGTGGTFLRTTDGGATWSKGTVSGAEKLDFRDVHAVNANTAYLLSIGPGGNSRIYKTNDAGRNWSLQYTEQNPKGFLDCMDFWDAQHGIAAGDSVDGHFHLLTTDDGGAHWAAVDPARLPAAQPGEGGFAASGTCIAVWSAGVPPNVTCQSTGVSVCKQLRSFMFNA